MFARVIPMGDCLRVALRVSALVSCGEYVRCVCVCVHVCCVCARACCVCVVLLLFVVVSMCVNVWVFAFACVCVWCVAGSTHTFDLAYLNM